MQIKRFSVTGLGGKNQSLSVELNSDLNILTGKNGSGKTTALKLMWYAISGNLERAISEVPFERFELETSDYVVAVNKGDRFNPEIKLMIGDEEVSLSYEFDEDNDLINDPVQEANNLIQEFGASVFFPTFRRIEGGFSIKSVRSHLPRLPSNVANRPLRSNQSPLEEAMKELSRRLSVGNHIFVASISTTDVVQLLMRNYTEMSERSNDLQQETSQEIIDQIKNFKRGKDFASVSDDPEKILDNIKATIEQLDTDREQILAPLNAVRTLAEQLFQHAGIALNDRLNFGDAAKAVSSEMLSAGEKQMLSFICYNAFNSNSVVFIDEPELSLHVDWQRQLFSILQGQGTSNQFVIATHSPFIYGKFPEKEILINEDRGDRFGENVS